MPIPTESRLVVRAYSDFDYPVWINAACFPGKASQRYGDDGTILDSGFRSLILDRVIPRSKSREHGLRFGLDGVFRYLKYSHI
jgi:hypothetical protein